MYSGLAGLGLVGRVVGRVLRRCFCDFHWMGLGGLVACVGD